MVDLVWRPDRRVSWSMVALLASLCGALLLGLVIWVPPAIGRDSGVAPVQPGLLTVAPKAAGVVTLGSGRAARLDSSGLLVTDGPDLLFQSVRGGSPISAVVGEVEGKGSDRREEIERHLSNFAVERLSITPGTARWSGALTDGERRLPATLSVRYDTRWIRVEVEVVGADGVIVHSAQELGTLGRAPVLPSRNLRKRAWWLGAQAPDDAGAYITIRQTDVAIGPRGTHRAVDLRRPGHTDIHVWSGAARLSVSSRQLDEVEQ